MIINVTGRGTRVQDSFRDLLEKKLSRFDRFFEKDAKAEVTVTNEGGRETVEITILSDGLVFRSEQTSADRHDSLDACLDALFRQITRQKSKLETKLRRSAFDAKHTDDTYLGVVSEEEDYNVVRTKRFFMKPMSVDEAILQMNLIGHQFYMFLNADTDETAVIYRRNDGDYGLIESER